MQSLDVTKRTIKPKCGAGKKSFKKVRLLLLHAVQHDNCNRQIMHTAATCMHSKPQATESQPDLLLLRRHDCVPPKP
jgi:hypothetical protein